MTSAGVGENRARGTAGTTRAANSVPPSARGETRRLNPHSPLWGSNGVAFGADGSM
ncbi:hypothetical protein [Streptomyces sp. AC495_CC817]|uniref:hypothetical protein n=1 Tax=Streptomyces sp. AC495_CC817 TaxID=2823900 RepID=UPI001C262E45|nr:hypothetical protein [Streptomyces sp. AC495_CC817]